MNKEQVLGAIRHALTFVGGVLVTKGLIGEGLVIEIIGSVIAVAGIVWSLVDKIKK